MFSSVNIPLTLNIYTVACHICADSKEIIITVKKCPTVFILSFVETRNMFRRYMMRGKGAQVQHMHTHK